MLSQLGILWPHAQGSVRGCVFDGRKSAFAGRMRFGLRTRFDVAKMLGRLACQLPIIVCQLPQLFRDGSI